jgi:hypothetical protein
MRMGVVGWVGGWPYFVYGWREVFVPLVVLAHNQHGPSLAVAALAVAATRLGGWLVHKTSLRRPLSEAGLLCGVALLFLGLAPEEGPASLLLWFLFGLGWPALHAGLVGRLWQGWAGLAVLLVGMLAAGPLVRGPGTWIIAAGCLLLAWQARKPMPQATKIEPAGPADETRWTPFLFSVAYLGWVWLLPIRLGEGTWAPELFAGEMAASWLARSLGAAGWQRNRAGSMRRFHGPAAAALLLVPAVAAVAMVQQLAFVALAFVAYGALMGVISTQTGIARGERGHLPGASQALGEWVGPLLGAGLVLVFGPPAVFVGAGLSAIALAWSLDRERRSRQD